MGDVFFVVCDGLKGLPDSVNTVWPQATVQTCIIHLIRGSFRYASRKYWDELARDLKPIYTAPSAKAAAAALGAVEDKWGRRYPAIIRLWRKAWEEFIPFLDYDIEIRRVICSTNAIESLNARYRRAVKARAPCAPAPSPIGAAHRHKQGTPARPQTAPVRPSTNPHLPSTPGASKHQATALPSPRKEGEGRRADYRIITILTHPTRPPNRPAPTPTSSPPATPQPKTLINQGVV